MHFNMPEHFTSRTDMIEWLIDNCPRPAVVRALQANSVEFLGGFTKIPPSNLPGWVFEVRLLIARRIIIVCILANDKKHKYEIRIVKCVPWKNWDGVFHGVLMKDSLNSGDKPFTYKGLYDAARQTSNRPPDTQ